MADKSDRECEGVITVSDRKKEFLVLELADGRSSKEVLERLAGSDIEVERFGSYEPSLNDIFVAKVGEEENHA